MAKQHDEPETFFYLDPPYYQCPYYKHNFAHEDFVELAERLRKIHGKFLLSLNDVSPIRAIFQGYQLKPVQVRYSAASKGSPPLGKELLISNYPLT